MVIDKIKKINPKEPDKKNEKASDMLVGKWVKCNKCKEILYKEDLKNNYSICPNCGQYFRLSSRRRIKQIIDEGTFNEINENMQTSDLLKFEGYKDIYVFVEQKNGVIAEVGYELISEARKLVASIPEMGFKVVGVLLGHQIADKANEVIAHGADKVIVVDDVLLKDYSTQFYADALTQVIENYKPDSFLTGTWT